MPQTELIAPIHAADASRLIALAEAAHTQKADLVELRLDRCVAAGAQLDEMLDCIRRFPLPTLVTNRHRAEGGAWPGGEQERLDSLLRADRAGARLIDVEFAHCADLPQAGLQARLVLSYHDFTGMPADLAGLAQRMFAAGADIAKIAVTPQDGADLAHLEQLASRCEAYELVAIGMGPVGLPSRLLAGAWCAPFTFGRLAEDDHGSAPGQPTLRDLRKLYRVPDQGPQTRIFGVLGNPVAHSLSPLIHNTAFIHHGIDAVYVPFQVSDAGAFWTACNAWIDGLSITIPHKSALLDHLHGIEERARRIGAINTIYRDEAGQAIGANTDADAAMTCIRSQVGNLDGCRALLLGAGGVARAIALALHKEGARVVISNRTLARAEHLAREIGCQAIALADAPTVDYRVLVNATSVGMNEDLSPWPADEHRPGAAVFDTVYTPLETRLLREAEAAGSAPICGLSMFTLQAVGQFERFCKIEAPAHLMHRHALEALGHSPDHDCGHEALVRAD